MVKRDRRREALELLQMALVSFAGSFSILAILFMWG